MRCLFCFYRPWAERVVERLVEHPRVTEYRACRDADALAEMLGEEDYVPEVVLFLGWSWIVPDAIVDSYLCLGIHPSDLPSFRGGSPIQNQIILGIEETKVSLFRLTRQLDRGEIWGKAPLSLKGDSVEAIFRQIAAASTKLLVEFFDKYPEITPQSQLTDRGSYYPRRTPAQSRIGIDDLPRFSLRDLYNFIRCLTDPYPNAYIEDNEGNRLVFKEVEWHEQRTE
jgi:methionyl-tRNA formyltransferase